MAVIKCKMCGGDIAVNEEKTFGTCEYCGSTMTLPKVGDDQRAALFNRGNHFRRAGEFDKALAIYENIVREDDADAEAHWCCALCRFGIEYVEDPNTYEFIPTCHRASFDSFLEDVDYLAALEHSDGITRRQYQKDGAKIAEVQKGILATSQNEEPFDVFICYKETDDNTKERTKDSIDAQEIYYQLTSEGYRVFFSRITLEDKAGSEYEPYIFAALNSAKVMIAIGSKPEYFNAVWVKNEWSRFLALMRKDRSKLLLPCYKNMDPYDLPEQLSVLQSYDMTKIGFIQDLIRGVKKVIAKEKVKAELTQPVVQQVVQQTDAGPSAGSLLKRAQLFLEEGEFGQAEEYFNKVLDIDPENEEAYIGLMLRDANTGTRAAFERGFISGKLKESRSFPRAKKFAKGENAAWLEKLERERAAEEERKRRKAAERAERERRESEEARIRLKPIRERLLPAQKLISAGGGHTVGLRVDGTVVAVGSNYGGQCDVSGWSDIVAVSSGGSHTVGLRADGTVVATKHTGEVSGWSDIVAVSAGGGHTVGLRADGTVVATKFTGDQKYYHGECDVSGWSDIVAVSAGSGHTVGLRADGTVVATKYTGDQIYYHGQCKVSGWSDIVAVSAGSGHTVGLRADGTVVAVGSNGNGECNVSGWSDIVAVSAGDSHTVGLRADCTVIAVGYNKYGQCNVSGWSDIVAVSAGEDHTVGLRADGTVVATKQTGEVSGWKLFNSFYKLDEERREAAERAENERRLLLETLIKRRAEAEAELKNLKGLFTGKRRKELEAEIAQLDSRIRAMQKA